jgi:hypothetical protein
MEQRWSGLSRSAARWRAEKHVLDVKDVLDKLDAGWTIDRVAQLTPRRWAAAQSAQ